MADVPVHGIGLSVDVYSPPLLPLVSRLEQAGMRPGYLEIFKAADAALQDVRRALPDARLAYHGEGVWMTEAHLSRRYPVEAEIDTAVRHVSALNSAWINYECAAKQIAGYSFGTYLPPLFTEQAADVVGANAADVQHTLDLRAHASGRPAPLLLLELPPLAYGSAGELPLAAFFRRVVERAPCGLVLDIGHLWTQYRYGRQAAAALQDYVERFLEEFPLERVVQIHLAGLDRRAGDQSGDEPAGPRWIDAHPAPIPDVVWDMLAMVLAHPRLTHLRGVALEVDNKAEDLIVVEYGTFVKRFGDRIGEVVDAAVSGPVRRETVCIPPDLDETVLNTMEHHYAQYAQSVGRRDELVHEILEWGGKIPDMFPRTCEALRAEGIDFAGFVRFWFSTPRPATAPYDFFLLKLDRFVEFAAATLPTTLAVAQHEAAELRSAYEDACTAIDVEVTA